MGIPKDCTATMTCTCSACKNKFQVSCPESMKGFEFEAADVWCLACQNDLRRISTALGVAARQVREQMFQDLL